MRDKAVRPAMVVFIMVLRIAVNSNPYGSNGARPKEFRYGSVRAAPENPTLEESPSRELSLVGPEPVSTSWLWEYTKIRGPPL